MESNPSLQRGQSGRAVAIMARRRFRVAGSCVAIKN
jgi:hypothetical protein